MFVRLWGLVGRCRLSWGGVLGAAGVVSRLGVVVFASAVAVRRLGGLSPFRWVCRGRLVGVVYVMLYDMLCYRSATLPLLPL